MAALANFSKKDIVSFFSFFKEKRPESLKASAHVSRYVRSHDEPPTVRVSYSIEVSIPQDTLWGILREWNWSSYQKKYTNCRNTHLNKDKCLICTFRK